MLKSGERLDRYEVVGLLGQGGVAQVYVVRHAVLGSEQVLKVLARADAPGAARLLREGAVQAAIDHPNVVSVVDVIDVHGAPGLVMERVDGPSLDRALAVEKLPWPLLDALVSGIGAGLAAAHAAGLVHRDLKPANVLLSLKGGRITPKVADFGLVKHLDGVSGAPLTASSATMGTPLYMAPEQIRGSRDVDRRADLWAFGVMLYEMATGRRPFAGASAYQVLEAVTAHRFTPVDVVDPSLPSRMVSAIAMCLRPVDERVGDVNEVVACWGSDGGQVSAAMLEGLRRLAPVPQVWLARSQTWAPPAVTGPTLMPARHLPAERDAFMGRAADLAALAERLAHGARLVTVVGFGGSGKTRLVTRFGWSSLAEYPGGVWFCDLSDARSLEGIAEAVARALNVPLSAADPVEQLGHVLAARGRCLLLLDNVEQVASHAAATLGRWLERSEAAVMVVTSRVVLAIPGEEVLPLEPLPVDEAVALFAARAASATGSVVGDPASV